MEVPIDTLLEAQFRAFYAAFNARDVDTVLAKMTPDVNRANGMTGGRVFGINAVRAYWRRNGSRSIRRWNPYE